MIHIEREFNTVKEFVSSLINTEENKDKPKSLYGKRGIYKIENILNNKVYVGSSDNLGQRKSKHFRDLQKCLVSAVQTYVALYLAKHGHMWQYN